jgi:SAM-dependent methyltransferase
VALAVGSGLFIGSLPVYGLHFFLCLLWCLPLGLDFVATYLAANISNPIVAPFLITLEVEVGSLVTTGHHAAFTLARAKQTGVLGFVFQAGIGSVFVGLGLAAIGASAAYLVARRPSGELGEDVLGASDSSNDERFEAAMLRTIERYRRAPIGDRLYVAGKLRADPVTRMLAALPGDFGCVLDAGAGRGQFGLLLSELGRVHSLLGFDSDRRKIDVFRGAAAGAARVELGDLLELPEGEVDTVLLIDVLHYLPCAEQDRLLREVARVARGRILIRELDAVPGARSWLTRVGEWLAKITGYNRGRAARHYRPASELVAELTRQGFSCDVLGASRGTPFGNVLIVATRA